MGKLKKTYRSKEKVHIVWVRVDDEFEDLLLANFSQDVSIGGWMRLTYVHFRSRTRRRFYQFL